MAKVIYNNLTFPFANITDFKHEVVYEESQTDYVLSKFDVSVMCVINLDYIQLLDPDNVLQGGATTENVNLMRSIRQRLVEPRRALDMSFNGFNLIPGGAGVAGSVDAKNGPQPMSCDFVDLSNNTFMLTWRVVAHYWENLSGFGDLVKNTAGNPALYNRWSDTQDIDQDGYTTRTRDGVFAIRSDNVEGFIVDDLRTQMAVVGIPSGFLRIGAKYTVTPDGLRMKYTLTDKEQFKMPPEPAKKATGVYVETVGKGEGKRTGQCRVRLSGNKTDSQALLISTAVAVVAGKLRLRGNQVNKAGKTGVLEYAKVSYGLYENWVECDMQCIYAIDTKRLKGVNAFGNMDTTLLLSDNLIIEPDYPTFGTCGPLLEAAKYYDPSLRGVAIQAGDRNLSAGLQVGQAGAEVEPAHYTPQ